jgi:hypothetical protein
MFSMARVVHLSAPYNDVETTLPDLADTSRPPKVSS